MNFKMNRYIFFTLLALLSLFYFNDLNAHPSKNHKPMVCILEEDRTAAQKQNCKTLLFFHRLCKLDQDCAILELEKQKNQIEQLEDKLGGVSDCGDIPFNHKSNKKTKIYKEASTKSDVVVEVEKDQELLFFAPSQKNKNWYYVKVRNDKICSDGYIQQKFVVKKEDQDTVVNVGPKLISIIQPNWEKEDELILINAEGTVSITGAIQEGKIDEIIINEQEEIINSDNTFTYLLFVPNSGAEVRIIGNKNGKKVKELSFKVRVGN